MPLGASIWHGLAAIPDTLAAGCVGGVFAASVALDDLVASIVETAAWRLEDAAAVDVADAADSRLRLGGLLAGNTSAAENCGCLSVEVAPSSSDAFSNSKPERASSVDGLGGSMSHVAIMCRGVKRTKVTVSAAILPSRLVCG